MWFRFRNLTWHLMTTDIDVLAIHKFFVPGYIPYRKDTLKGGVSG